MRGKLAGIAVSTREVVLLELLSALRGSIFFEEKYRVECDVLWIACLEGKQELELKALHNMCKSFGITESELDRVFDANMVERVQVKEMVKRLCEELALVA